MNYVVYTERMNYLLELIKKGRVQSPLEVACIFSCNEKTIRNMIKRLRDSGYIIVYSKKEKKYLFIIDY
jgi:biotin operon repressor